MYFYASALSIHKFYEVLSRKKYTHKHARAYLARLIKVNNKGTKRILLENIVKIF